MLAMLIVLVLYLRTWRDEFIFLMGLRDDVFPGHNDKLIWVLLLVLTPVGVWLFRSYRLAHWPRPERTRHPEAGSAGAAVPSPS
jgi:hypothetical protein